MLRVREHLHGHVVSRSRRPSPLLLTCCVVFETAIECLSGPAVQRRHTGLPVTVSSHPHFARHFVGEWVVGIGSAAAGIKHHAVAHVPQKDRV